VAISRQYHAKASITAKSVRREVTPDRGGVYRAAATLDVTEKHPDAIMAINTKAAGRLVTHRP